jgi:hypothetical protein
VIAYIIAYLVLDYVSYLKPGTFGYAVESGFDVALIYLGGPVYGPLVLVLPRWRLCAAAPLAWYLEIASSITLGAIYVAAGTFLRRLPDFDPLNIARRDIRRGDDGDAAAVLWHVIDLGGELTWQFGS